MEKKKKGQWEQDKRKNKENRKERVFNNRVVNSKEEQLNANEEYVEGRNPVLEAFRSGRTVDRLFVLDGCHDGPVQTIVREAKKQNCMISFVTKERLD